MRRHCWWTGEKEPASAATGQKADVAAAPRLFRETWNRFGRLPAVRIEAEEGGSELAWCCPIVAAGCRDGWAGRARRHYRHPGRSDAADRAAARSHRHGRAGAGDQLARCWRRMGRFLWRFFVAGPWMPPPGETMLRRCPICLRWPRRCADRRRRRLCRWRSSTSGACEVTGGETVVPGQTAYLGLAKVLGQEMTWLQPRVIDIDRCSDGGLAATLAAVPPEQVQALRGGFLALGLRSGGRPRCPLRLRPVPPVW